MTKSSVVDLRRSPIRGRFLLRRRSRVDVSANTVLRGRCTGVRSKFEINQCQLTHIPPRSRSFRVHPPPTSRHLSHFVSCVSTLSAVSFVSCDAVFRLQMFLTSLDCSCSADVSLPSVARSDRLAHGLRKATSTAYSLRTPPPPPGVCVVRRVRGGRGGGCVSSATAEPAGDVTGFRWASIHRLRPTRRSSAAPTRRGSVLHEQTDATEPNFQCCSALVFFVSGSISERKLSLRGCSHQEYGCNRHWERFAPVGSDIRQSEVVQSLRLLAD